MKILNITLIICLLSVCDLKAQGSLDKDIKLAWEYFFNEEFNKSSDQFERIYMLDRNDVESLVGLFYSKSLSQNEISFDLLEKIPGDSEYNFYKYGMTATVLIEYYSTPVKEREEPFDFSLDQFKAFHTDGFVKTKEFEGQYSDQEKVGIWKYYSLGGELIKKIEYSDSTNIHVITYYHEGKKTSEELAEIEERENSVFQKVLKKTIFYQELPDKISEYLFVSKEGFCVYNEENPIILDESTPDNIIEEEVSLEGVKYFIWKNGKRSLYLDKKY